MKLSIALLGLAATAAQAATDADLQRCRALAEAAARLACYDAIVPSVAAPTPAPVAAAPAAAPEPAAAFGFEARAWEKTPETIESRISGPFDGWGPNSLIRLDNGQVWQVSDGSRGVMAARDPKVRVSRGTMGTFFLEIEGKRQAPRVRRVE